MFEGRRVIVVVPAYNEEKLIGQVLDTMPTFVDRIVVVDDASRDRTPEILDEAGKRIGDRLRVIRHKGNSGVGAAIVTGYRAALDGGAPGDLVAVMAGDAQMDPDDLPRLLMPLVKDQADYTKGNRLFTGEAWKIIPRYRYLGNAVLSLLTKVASGYWHVADSQSGYTAVTVEALRVLQLDRLYPRYGFPNHLLVELNNYDFRVRDVPIRPVYNVGEVSGIRLHRVIPTSELAAREVLLLADEGEVHHPRLPSAGVLPDPRAARSPAAGFLLGLYIVYLRIFHGALSPNAVIFDAFCLIMGMQMLFFAMWMDMEHNKGLR